MAKWQDVADAERRATVAVRERNGALADRDKLQDFIRETGQVDAFMEWYAKRLGLHETLYAANGQSPTKP